MFEISVYFLCKNSNFPEKSHPYLSQQSPSEILRYEDWDPAKPLLFENLVEGSAHNLLSPRCPPPPAEREEGNTLWSLFAT